MTEQERDDAIDLLRSHALTYKCGTYLNAMESIYRFSIYQDLAYDRLQRKYHDLMGYFPNLDNNWNQLMLSQFMRWLSDKYNRHNYYMVAMAVGYKNLMAESDQIRNMEAMLIAASGLGHTLPKDYFTEEIRDCGEYMLYRYNITPLAPEDWVYRNVTNSKAFILRLVQVANLFYHKKSLINDLLQCRNRNDVISLFNVSAREEWCKYFGQAATRKIGVEKCDILGINFVTPLMDAIGRYMNNDTYLEAAMELTEAFPAENNSIIRGWREKGLLPSSSYETQALIELRNEYCKKKRCEECLVFNHICSPNNILKKLPGFLSGKLIYSK